MHNFLLLLLLVSSVIQAQTKVSLNSQSGPVNRVFEMELESEQSQQLSEPDFSLLEQDFSILNNSKFSVSNFRNGVTLYKSRWTLRLRPKTSGALTVPGIRIGSERSRSLIYTATEQEAEQTQSGLFIESDLTPDLNYSRAAYILSTKLFFSQNLTSAELTEPHLDNVLIERLGPQRNYGEIRNGIDFQVIEQRYVLFPLTPGRYTVPVIEFTGSTETEHLHAQSETLKLEALSPPAEIPSDRWLTATELRIEEQWQPSNSNEFQVGDTIIRTLIIEAHNTPAAWLPTLAIPAKEGYSVYPQTPELSQDSDTGTLVSRKQITYKILLTKAGDIELPAISINWWDTIRDQAETSTLKAVTLNVAGFSPSQVLATAPKIENKTTQLTDLNPAASNAVEEPTEDTTQPWMAWLWAAIALVCATGWSFTQLKLKQTEQQLATRAATPPQQVAADHKLKERDYMLEETNAFNRLSRACSVNAPEEVAQQLIQWAKFSWPHETISDLADLEIFADDPTLAYLLRDLEHHLYRSHPDDEPWQGDLVLNQITRLRKRIRSNLKIDAKGPAEFA